MVSIEDKINYQLRINENQKLTAFNNLLLGNSFAINPNSDINETDEIYFGIAEAIHSNDKVAFETHYSKKKKSNPNKDSPSPFVNDDFLIFCLILGIVKFNENKSWIKNIISLRSRNAITITFENLLTDNFYSKSNLPEVILMFLQLNSQSLISNDILTTAFKSISENTTLFDNKSDFHIVCSLRAYDLIIELKEAADGSEVNLLRRFNERFLKRIRILCLLLQGAVLFGLTYALLKLPKYTPETVELINKYSYAFTVLGALGFTFLGNQIPLIRNKSQELVMRLFGYPKELIIKSKNT